MNIKTTKSKKITFKKILTIISLSFVSLVLLFYVAYSSVRYWRSTFFIYPDIKDKYEIVGKIDTPEEALEVCRSGLGATRNGEYLNFMGENIWHSRVRSIKENPFYGPGVPMYFQIRVIKHFNDNWSVLSSLEYQESKECFFCTRIEFSSHPTTSRCHITSNGKKLKRISE